MSKSRKLNRFNVIYIENKALFLILVKQMIVQGLKTAGSGISFPVASGLNEVICIIIVNKLYIITAYYIN